MDAHDRYRSPLVTRNASAEMLAVWSPRRKFSTWRTLWLALAKSQQTLGLPITDEQIDELRAHLDDIDFDAAGDYEKRLRHDVMAHIQALGDVAPTARPIVHLGATSQFVGCNTDLILLRDSLDIIAAKTAAVIIQLTDFATRHRDTATLAFTHFQPAQPTTVGKRATMWAQDLVLCLERIERTRADLQFRGIKGTTGTAASFLHLFDGDHDKVKKLDAMLCERFGFERSYAATGQTYPRVVDAMILSDCACLAAAIHRMCSDIRLLAHRKEIEEPFEAEQVGSSAMPYKRNPMRCERATGLCRFVISLVHNAYDTAATQWLERTLDDSANRRLSLPESFLALDGVLDICRNVTAGLVVHQQVIRANLLAELPFMASENLMMEAVKLGRDRQAVHEAIRQHAQAAAKRVKEEGLPNDLLDRLARDPLMAGVNFDETLDPGAYVGRAPEQVDEFVMEIVEPIRARYAGKLDEAPDLSV
ncbi:MAG: adenylosuccinate lyase [Phycisphaerales bacterium]|nr:adenylosuccinate lyase [Phycisphaerales bacterium]